MLRHILLLSNKCKEYTLKDVTKDFAHKYFDFACYFFVINKEFQSSFLYFLVVLAKAKLFLL